jgi:diguanylate cyclase (GGDEF)-like protein
VVIFLALAGMVFIIGALFFKLDAVLETLISSILLVLIFLSSFLFSLCVVFNKENDIRLRRGWLLLGVAAISYMFGELFWFYYESILRVDPFPSLADPFYILFYPLILGGLLLFPFAPENRYQRRMLGLDLAIVVTTCSMYAWYFIAAPLTSTYQGLDSVLGVTYPVGDILLFTGISMLIQRDLEKVVRRPFAFLACALVIMALADSVFSYLDANKLYYSMVYPDVLWLISSIFFLFAVAWQVLFGKSGLTDKDLDVGISQHSPRLVLPYLAVGLGVGLLLYTLFINKSIGKEAWVLLHGTLVLIGIVLFRQYVVLRENVNLYNETKKLACTDVLTGLYNRHFFNGIFPVEIKRAERYKKPLSILLVDIDGFKVVNDSLGHLKGDEILKIIAQKMAQELRASDLIARFGGDEFVILLPETDESSAQMVIDRMKIAISRERILGMQLGISIGLAIYRSLDTPEQLLDKADASLYRQKRLLARRQHQQSRLYDQRRSQPARGISSRKTDNDNWSTA